MARNVSVREIYFYLVCIIAIIVFIIGLVGLADGIINYLRPNNYITFERIPYKEQYPEMTDEQIDNMIQEELANSLANEKTYALKSMIRNAIMIIIAVPLFVFHWKKAQQLWLMNLAS